MARGTIIKRGDAWRIAVELEPDAVTGKRRRQFSTLHGTHKDAEKELARLLGLVDQNKLGSNSRLALAQFLDR